VESPPVWEGPIFAQIQITIGNGCQWVGKKFVLPFSTKIGYSAEGETSDRYVQRYLEFEAKRRRRIDTVLKDACRGLAERYLPSALVNLVPKTWKRSPVAVRKPVVLPPLPETPAEGMTVPMRQRIPEDQLDELIELQPEQIIYRHEKIRVAIRDQDHAAVTAACREALRRWPDDLWMQMTLAESLCLGGNSAEALKQLAEIVRQHPRFPLSYEFRSQLYADLGAVKPSLEEADRAVQLAPRNSPLRQWRARLKGAIGEYKEALEDLAIARTLDPHDAETYGWMAYIRCRSGEVASEDPSGMTAALADIDRSLQLDGESIVAHLARAEISLLSSRYDKAIEDCDWILARRPESSDALACRGAAYLGQNEIQSAIGDLSSALRLGSQLGYVGPMLIDAQHRLGDSSAALATADEIIAQHGDYLPVLLRRQALLRELGHLTEALEVINTIIDLQPKLAAAFSERGNVHRSLEDLAAAEQDYEMARSLGACDWAMILNHAMTLFELNRLPEALERFDQGIAAAPTHPAAYFQRGRLQAQLERYDRAIADFTEVLRLDDQCFEAYFLRASCHVSQDDYPSAIRDLDLLVEHAPSGAAFAARAQAKILAGDFAAGDLDIQQAIECDQGQAEEFRIAQHVTEARYHGRSADFDAAIAAANEALEIDDRSVVAIRTRASYLWYGNFLVEAIDDLTRVLEIAGTNVRDLSARGQVYGELGEYELSLTDLDESIALAGEEVGDIVAYSQSGRGVALTGLKKYEEAAIAFEKSIQLCPGNAWVHYHHGLYYLEIEQVRQAAICFRLSLQLSGPSLRPRQRARAIAFLANQNQNENGQSSRA
jgi:tetratricopeptide (TPR) repeat protein